jgi:hypothetical protein
MHFVMRIGLQEGSIVPVSEDMASPDTAADTERLDKAGHYAKYME